MFAKAAIDVKGLERPTAPSNATSRGTTCTPSSSSAHPSFGTLVPATSNLSPSFDVALTCDECHSVCRSSQAVRHQGLTLHKACRTRLERRVHKARTKDRRCVGCGRSDVHCKLRGEVAGTYECHTCNRARINKGRSCASCHRTDVNCDNTGVVPGTYECQRCTAVVSPKAASAWCAEETPYSSPSREY